MLHAPVLSRFRPARLLDPRPGALLVGLLLLMLWSGCGGEVFKPNAVGPEGQVLVVMDSTRWDGRVGEAVREHIGPYISTLPAPERAFDLRQISMNQQTLDIVQSHKNVVIIAPLSDSTNVANFLRARFSQEAQQAIQQGQTAVVARPNLWRRNQRVFFVAAQTPQGLIEALETKGQRVRETFHQVTLDRMQTEMFDRGRQFALEDTLMQHHGFAVNVQHDYQIAVDTTTDSTGFVWLRRILPETRRGLFIYYKENADPSTLSEDWIYATRDSLTQQYLRGTVGGYVAIDYRRPLTTEQIEFLGRFGYETRGLWYMIGETEDGERIQYGGGGPFVNYAFYDQQQDRIYMIDGMVFAPGYDKRTFIRQMEVIAHTFRTRPEVQPDAAAPATTD